MDNLIFYIEKLERELIALNHNGAEAIIREVSGLNSPMQVAGELITQVLEKIGEAWDKGNISLSQVYMSGVICEKIIDKLLPPADPSRKGQPKMAIAVFEDYHQLGKRIIYSTLRASGFEIMDLGAGLDIESIVDIVNKEKIKILLLSVLMLPAALNIKKLKVRLSGKDVKIIVGGAPFRFDSELWKEIGADACGTDSSQALEIVSGFQEKKYDHK